jgi:hypothetical protein
VKFTDWNPHLLWLQAAKAKIKVNSRIHGADG